ncbi:hypothetical protein ACHRV5_20975 [Flavobacterium sp. FlaQc-52]|jgi:hypothetical protein|uniref:hypothetical protein n=1 Tax=Flavobacterium sp. FlaQc-52 TaxID=3374185 RepID=UPI0037566744
MKTIFTLAITVLMSVGVFANSSSKNINPEVNKEINKSFVIENKIVEPALESNPLIQVYDVTVDCGDGTGWAFTCDGCSIGQIVDLALELCS